MQPFLFLLSVLLLLGAGCAAPTGDGSADAGSVFWDAGENAGVSIDPNVPEEDVNVAVEILPAE